MRKNVSFMREIRRQFLHIFVGSIFILLVWLLGTAQMLFVSTAILLLGAIASALVVKNKAPALKKLLEKVERAEEKAIPGKGALMFFLGFSVLLALNELWFQNTMIVIGALGVTVYGDGFATMFGTEIGRMKFFGDKTVEGSITAFTASFIFLAPFFEPWIAFTIALITMIVEMLPLNDNLSIPIISGIVLKILL